MDSFQVGFVMGVLVGIIGTFVLLLLLAWQRTKGR